MVPVHGKHAFWMQVSWHGKIWRQLRMLRPKELRSTTKRSNQTRPAATCLFRRHVKAQISGRLKPGSVQEFSGDLVFELRFRARICGVTCGKFLFGRRFEAFPRSRRAPGAPSTSPSQMPRRPPAPLRMAAARTHGLCCCFSWGVLGLRSALQGDFQVR